MKALLVAFAVFVFGSWAAHAQVFISNLPVPSHNDWQCVTQDISSKAIRQGCVNNTNPPTQIIAEYRYKEKTPEDTELLVWLEFIDPDHSNQMQIIVRAYRSVQDAWEFVDTSVFRVSAMPVGVKTPVFSGDSNFGKLFNEFLKRSGARVELPYLINSGQ